MIGVSVSLYDKFEDLGVLLDIVRNNWEDEYFVSVCSNHPNAHEKVSDLSSEIDHFEQGAQIDADESIAGRSKRVNFLLRVNNTIRTAIRGALSCDEVDHVLHLHSDAWPLSEEGLQSLIDSMDERDASVAFKTSTEKFLEQYPPGHFMDQFLLFNATDCRSAGLFERELLEYPPGIHSHRLLPMVCLVAFGWGSIWHYSNRSEEVLWDGEPTLRAGRRVRPMTYNPKYAQVHIAREDFGPGQGKSLQAYYLDEHGLTEGEYIDELLTDHLRDRDTLFDDIAGYYAQFDEELKWYYGVSTSSLGRSTRDIVEFTDLDGREKMMKVLGHNVDVLANGVYDRFQQLMGDSSPDIRTERKTKELDLHKHYTQALNKDTLPEDLRGKHFMNTYNTRHHPNDL
ncbi:hypothetical protein [Natrarchaeobius halalkaliphilus]|nr:hypothetical protein [Natrarchaeobius halalkaliphilus]